MHRNRVKTEILPCRKNPPIAAAGKIQKPYVYKVRGNGEPLHQLVDYIKENVREQDRVEFKWDVIGWMERFQGVGTRYLDNYLYWFRWLELGKNFR